MSPAKIAIFLLFAFASLVKLEGYEVWIGTHLMRSSDANNLDSWSLTASQVDGFNVNRAPHDTDPASNSEYRTIFAQFSNAGSAITEFARSQATRDPVKTDELAFPSIAQRLEEIFSLEGNFGYELTAIMFYDERGTFQGTEYLYEWTEIEIQYLRDWLDTNGHSDIELKWNVRNNSLRNQQISAMSVVDSVEIEASTTALLNNTNNQITFFTWYWNNPATVNKPIALQIPRTLDGLNQIRGTREVAQMIGGIIGYGEDGMRSDRLIFLPVTYNDNYDFSPETISGGTSYTNSLSSIALSLIEQRSLFEGRVRVPTVTDAHNLTRHLPPMVSPISDQTVAYETSTGSLPFTVGDDLTPVSSLTVTANSSDPGLVPAENIVVGGSDANRTVTVTPAVGQSGSAEIELWVDDGSLASPIIFTVTVLEPGLISGILLSQSSDCAIKETPAIEKVSDAIVDVGARGASPWVERCAVYVFELPDLGAVSDPFQEADFVFEFVGKNSSLRGHDLYGLGRRADATVEAGDYYSQTSTIDPTDATRLQQSILTNSTPLGLVRTSGGGSSNLVNYLNAQYAGGAGVGEYVFLRINTRAPKSGLNYAMLTMSEGGVSGPVDTRPRITYQANDPDPGVEVNEVIAGWDTWESSTSPSSTVTAPGVTASATASAVGGTANWSNTDGGGDPGRGSSDDATWGSFGGNGDLASSVTIVGAANLTVTNAKTDAQVTFTITNNGGSDIELEAFHFDALAFRPKAPRSYSLSVLPGSDITVGNVFTSGLPTNDNSTNAISHLGGALIGHDQHDEVDLDLRGLADSTLEVGGTVIFQLEFKNGVGDGAGGHHLFLDNVAVSGSGATAPFSGIENWRFVHFGMAENSGAAADDFDANGDGEDNLLEFATHQNPNAPTLLSTSVGLSGGEIRFTYLRSKAALADGMGFQVEWSDTLLPGSWSAVGVVESVVGETEATQSVVANLPTGNAGPRFIRLKVVTP
ncbi:MAG: hypothetical protein ACON38_19345 [Akkermansiaceae bacterium]